MELAAAVTITGTVLSLLNNARRCLQMLANDIDNFHNQGGELTSLASRLSNLTEELQLWKTLWKVNRLAPRSFHHLVWGVDGLHDIQRLLGTIQGRIQQIQCEIEQAFAVKFSSNGHLRSYSGNLSLKQRLTANDASYWRRLVHTVVGSEILERHMSTLQLDVNQLSEMSKWSVLRRHGLRVPTESRPDLGDWVDELHFNFQLEENSTEHSQALFEGCLLPDIVSVKLDVTNLIVPRAQNQAETGAISHMPKIEYHLVVTRQLRSSIFDSTYFTIFAVSIGTPHDVCQQSVKEHFLDTHGALEHRCDHPNCQRHFRLRTSAQGSQCRNFQNVASYSVGSDHSNLRASFRARNSDSVADSSFNRLERLSLAYHLAKFTFTMLQTGWVSKICSCAIYFLPTFNSRTYYIDFRGNVHQSCSDSGQRGNLCEQWCRMFTPDMPITCLGLLLMEIALDRPICHIYQKNLRGLYQVINHPDPQYTQVPRTQSYNISQLMSEVTVQTSADYAGIVRWCLNQSLEPINSYSHALRHVYFNILQPLHIRYKIETAPGRLAQDDPTQRSNLAFGLRELYGAR